MHEQDSCEQTSEYIDFTVPDDEHAAFRDSSPIVREGVRISTICVGSELSRLKA